ncbi:MAG: phosphate ABC transporter permease subunit PstC [Deltaproteobacteria bacterium]|nr:phosphate ABC transporter permease subunit PstC [Deltaproteobacteria bacterium]MDQ3296206.1 phosphate ABC transporter permease subunit PstC [Myxococcota bacterium]
MQLSELHARSQHADRAFRVLAVVAATTVLVVLALITVTMSKRAWPVLEHMGLDFFTSSRWSAPEGIYGALPFIFGTLFTATIALALAVPVSLGVALFITQVAPPWLKKPMVYLLDLLAVVPSVVFGLWGVLVLSQHFGLGRSFLTAGIILAVMITPIITSLSREVIETTPQTDKEAALALGATRWEMIGASVLPHSKGGLVGAVMLGLGRALGETIAAALVIGSALGQITLDPYASGNSMPAVIANEFGESDGMHKSALIALAVTLFVITIIVNLVATAIVQRSMRRSRGT